MDILVVKFRVNDLKDDTGKQIEFGPKLAANFFGFKEPTETLKLKYISLIENDPLNNQEFNQKATISSKRGDYKIYNATESDRNVKRFLIEDLHLNQHDNINDFLTFQKIDDKEYIFSWIKADTEIGKYFTTLGYNGKIISFNNPKTEINKPYNRIIFGAPGTGKSHKLKEDSELFYQINNNDLKNQFIDELKNLEKEPKGVKGGKVCTIGIKYSQYLPFDNEQSLSDFIKKSGISDSGQNIANITTEIGYGIACSKLLNLKYDLTLNDFVERVTFHPNYSYAQFVGTYKPTTRIIDKKEEITYEYVPGPFIRTLIKAKKTDKNCLLIIEEINRANVAAVFGDIFQLLDRDVNGNSEYPITTSEDLRKFLAKEENLGGTPDKYTTLSIPSNMYIWATMNSADQGVQPMDAAFKRRWEFEYLNINNSEKNIDDNMKQIQFPDDKYNWNQLRHLINNRLSNNYNVNEDKLLGPFFIKKGNQDDKQFIELFKCKVLMYLFEDVCKINPKALFAGINKTKIYFSDVIDNFNNKGIGIFNFSDDEKQIVIKEIETGNQENITEDTNGNK